MDISKVNDLLGQVRVRLESLDPNNTDENIQTMNSVSPKSLSAANSKLASLMAKMTGNRNKSNKVSSTGSGKRS